jgi:hypothetical protein
MGHKCEVVYDAFSGCPQFHQAVTKAIGPTPVSAVFPKVAMVLGVRD